MTDSKYILAEYLIKESKDSQQVCFLAFNFLHLSSSENKWSLYDLRREIGNPNLKPWEEYTKQSIQVFYDAFKVWKGSDTCFPIK